jgi:prolyl-tRNA editing enzyme YbaK/EbsC (Cys-tRNA(Pro) deacylase)
MASKTTKLPAKLVKYLEKAGIKHEVLEHKTVYTAIDAANTLKKKVSDIAKSLLVKADKDYYLVLLPADQNLDLGKLKKTISQAKGKEIKVVKIPGEKIVENALKIKASALSAFGKMHNLPMIVDKKLDEVKKVVFSSGSLNHSLEIAMKEFKKLEEPIVGNFGVKKKIKVQKKIAKKKTTPLKKKLAKRKK